MAGCSCQGTLYLRHDDLIVPQGALHSVFWEVEGFDPADWLSAKAQARSGPGGTLRQEWSTGAGTITFGATGVTMLFPKSMSDPWTWTSAVYDLLLFPAPSGDPVRFTQGKISVSQAVTV